RNDFQVKIRGFRVELGEIEARLSDLPWVRDVVVVAREDEPGEKRLVAYYTCVEEDQGQREGSAGARELRQYLMERFPEYMVPAAYVRLDRLPYTASGKLHRKALPAPTGDAYVVRGYQAPVGEIEIAIARVWTETLKLEKVGRHDNFFAL